jgi:hypothetical protein
VELELVELAVLAGQGTTLLGMDHRTVTGVLLYSQCPVIVVVTGVRMREILGISTSVVVIMPQVVELVDLLETELDTLKHNPTEVLVQQLVALVQELVVVAVMAAPPTHRLVQMVQQGLTEMSQTDLVARLVARLGELSHSQEYQLTQSLVQTLEQFTVRIHNGSNGGGCNNKL